MKKHFVNLLFDCNGKNYIYQGLVTGKNLYNGKVIIDPWKVFKIAFGFDAPINSRVMFL